MIRSTVSALRIEHAAEMLKALAHPVRLSIVDLIAQNQACTVSQIQQALGLEQAVVSQQLSILRGKDVLICLRAGKNSVYSMKYPCLSEILETLKACNS
jgi:DNA-binding transcriptional ArsR family regulator